MRAITVRNFFLFVIALVLTACGGENGGAPTQATSGPGPTIESLQLTPANSRVPVGFEQQLTAQALLSDGTVTDVTQSPRLIWSSSDPDIATVDIKGLVTGVKVGTVTITATGTNAGGQNFSATAQVEVTDAVVTGLQVTPATARVPVGFGQAYVAIALLSDGSTLDVTHFSGLSWSSSNTSIATISNEAGTKGLATGVDAGTTTITASGTANGTTFSASATLTVTNAVVTALQVTPATATVAKGLTRQYTAIAVLSDGSTLDVTTNPAVSWNSSDTSTASISNAADTKGLAAGVNAGTVTITASGTTNGTSFTGTATLTVTNAVVTALQVIPATASVARGLTRQYIAIATLSDNTTVDVTDAPALNWTTSATTIATIGSAGNDNGLATGVNPGTVTVTASGTANGTQFRATATLTVTNATITALQVIPATASVARGLTRQFTAIATFSDGNQGNITFDPAVSWRSSDTTIATIGSVGNIDSGKATGVNPGTITITASGIVNGKPFIATAQLTVTNATVTALQVTPATTSVARGLTRQFTAIATFSDGNQGNITFDPAVSWRSSDTTIATIGSAGNIDSGKATGVNPGTVTITASGIVNGTPFSATAQLTVTNAIVTELQVTPATSTVGKGLSQQYTATAILSDGSTADVTDDPVLSWTTNDTNIATIGTAGSNNGLATGVNPGVATISANGTNSAGTPFSATATLTVTDAVATALQIIPTTTSVGKGLSQQYTAIATLSDGSTADVTNDPDISWTSSNTGIATIVSNQASGNGLATSLNPGTVTITAGGTNEIGTPLSATATLTVTDAVAISLQITPANASVAKGLTLQYTAIATLSDGSTADVTNDPDISWTSSNINIATIGSVGVENGLATGVGPGVVTITASGTNENGTPVSGTATLTVTDAVITALQVTPASASVGRGLSQQYTAIATFSDGSQDDVTVDSALSWTSSDSGIATISSTGSDKGLAIGVNTGSVTITASSNVNGRSVSATATLTVTNAVAISLKITPSLTSVATGLTRQFTAMATLSDGSTSDVTNDPDISWTSSNINIATIGTSGTNDGLATGVTAGSVTITASGFNENGTLLSTTARLTVTDVIVTALQVTPNPASVAKGLTQQFTAIATFSDGSTQEVTNDPALSWTTGDTGIATIGSAGNNNGLATGVNVGSVTITASGTVDGTPFSATATLTVTNAIVTALQITPPTALVAQGLAAQFTAIATLSDTSMVDVTHDQAINWTTNDTSIATIGSAGNNNGLATGVNPGDVTITASGTNVIGTKFSADATLTVVGGLITKLLIAPTTGLLGINETKDFHAIVAEEGGGGQIITDAVNWSSSDPSIATVGNTGPADNGTATGVSTGTVTITASGEYLGEPAIGTASLTVSNAPVTALQVFPPTTVVSKGLTQQYTAIAKLSDGSIVDVTGDQGLSWTSNDPTIATIVSNEVSGNGKATGVSPGTVTITVSGALNGTSVSGTASLIVVDTVAP